MGKKRFLMMVRIGVAPKEIETEWNRWYDCEHIPKRLKIPGFISARRYKAVENEYNILIRTGPPDEIQECPRRYITFYELSHLDVLSSQPYLELLHREASLPPDSFEAVTVSLPDYHVGLYEQIYPGPGDYHRPKTRYVFVIGHDAPPEKEEEFNAWYNTEHIPGFIKKVPGFDASRRFRRVEATLPTLIGLTPLHPKYVAIHDLENEEVPGSEGFLSARDTPWTRWIKSWYTRRFRFLSQCIYSSD
jgi:hypothetical protein